jgi:branched-chain amino acid transport system substrate-binding protein
MLGEAITGTKSLDDNKIADYLKKNTHKTIMGDWSYGPGGEWTKSGMLQVQYHDIKDGAGLDVWKGMSYQTVLTPADLKTGNVIYPYEKAKK